MDLTEQILYQIGFIFPVKNENSYVNLKTVDLGI